MATSYSNALFTRNPILLQDAAKDDNMRPFEIQMGGKTIYTGHYMPPVTMDVSEIADSFTPALADASECNSIAPGLIRIAGSTSMAARAITVTANGTSKIHNQICIAGGVSPQNYRRHYDTHEETLRERFVGKNGNFFLTTRTHRWLIEIPETELFPLYFLNLADDSTRLRFEVPETDIVLTWPALECGIYALDLQSLREEIYSRAEFWPSAFDVFHGDFLACRIVITESPVSKLHTVLKFRNSLGAFEMLDLTGDVDISHTATETDESGRMGFDEISFTFAKSPARKSMETTLNVESGHKTGEQLAFMLDMLASDEVYLKDRTGWIRVDASAEDFKRSGRQTEPESATIKLTFCDVTDNITPGIKDEEDFTRPRIFSDQHTDEFN